MNILKELIRLNSSFTIIGVILILIVCTSIYFVEPIKRKMSVSQNGDLVIDIEKRIDSVVKKKEIYEMHSNSNSVNNVKEPTWNNNNFYSDYEEYDY